MKYVWTKASFLAVSFLLLFSALHAELSENNRLEQVEETEEQAWPLFINEYFSIRFPSLPYSEQSRDVINYSAADASCFPIIVYSLTSFKPNEAIDSAKFIDDVFLNAERDQQMILWNEITEIDGVIVLDLMSSPKYTSLVRKDHVVILKDEVYVLTTTFYPIGVDNHDFFVESFSLHRCL